MTETTKPKSLAKQAAMQILAGGSAGFVEVSIMHPLDLVKTRFQLQIKLDKTSDHVYTGVVDCMKKMYKTEGLLSFWKGVLPPLLVETPKRAVKFFTFEQYKTMFTYTSMGPTPVTFSLAGLCSGMTEAVLVNPFEVVKVNLQANRMHHTISPGTWSVARTIIQTSGFGLNGLNKGLTATVARNGAFNMVYFGFYHSVKNIIPQNSDPTMEFLRKICIGLASGILASCFNIPFDVAKSRIQGPQPPSNPAKYVGTLRTMKIVYSEEGFRALYKGLIPKVMRLGPGGAIMLLVYEHVYEYLDNRFS